MASEGLPSLPNVLPDIPTFRSAKDEGSILGLPQNAEDPSFLTWTNSRSSTRDLLAMKADADADSSHTDSDSTICAERSDPVSFVPPVDENRSESEEGISQRPVRMRRPRPVPSIASTSLKIIRTKLRLAANFSTRFGQPV